MVALRAAARFQPTSNVQMPSQFYGLPSPTRSGGTVGGGGAVNTLPYTPQSNTGWQVSTAWDSPLSRTSHGDVFNAAGQRVGNVSTPHLSTWNAHSNVRGVNTPPMFIDNASGSTSPVLRSLPTSGSGFSSGTLGRMESDIRSFADSNLISKLNYVGSGMPDGRSGSSILDGYFYADQFMRNVSHVQRTSVRESGTYRSSGPNLTYHQASSPQRALGPLDTRTTLRSNMWTASHGVVDQRNYSGSQSARISNINNFFNAHVAAPSEGYRFDMLGQRSMGYQDLGDKDVLGNSGFGKPGRVNISFNTSGGGRVSWSGGGFSY